MHNSGKVLKNKQYLVCTVTVSLAQLRQLGKLFATTKEKKWSASESDVLLPTSASDKAHSAY